jgi:hypothetical protein
MQFQTSQYSDLGGFASANPDDFVGPLNEVEVRDVPGNMFRVNGNGIIEVLSGPGKGSKYDANSSIGKTMIANLSDVPGNEEKIKSVLGSSTVDKAIATPRLPAPPAQPSAAVPSEAAEKGAVDATPLTKRTWFWPVVILGVAGVAGAAIVFWPKKGAAASFA